MTTDEVRHSSSAWRTQLEEFARTWLPRLRDEFIEVWLITAYFVVAFSLFIGLKALLLLDYGVRIHVIVPTFMSAAVVAKAVAVSRKLRIQSTAEGFPVWVSVLIRTMGYSAAAFGATVVEELFETREAWGTISEGLRRVLAAEHLGEHVALVVFIAVALLVLNVFEEISRHFGFEALRTLFVRPRGMEVQAGRGPTGSDHREVT